MALSSFLNVNGYDFPCPRVGFSYTITTTVNAGRNANNAVIGQRIGRDLIKLDNLEWLLSIKSHSTNKPSIQDNSYNY